MEKISIFSINGIVSGSYSENIDFVELMGFLRAL